MAIDKALEDKLMKLSGGEEFRDEVWGQTTSQLEDRIATLQKQLDESEEHKSENVALRDAKYEVSIIEGPYNDVKKAVKVKTKFLIELIKDKGGV